MVVYLNYSFDDEIVDKFCYSVTGKKIEIHFSAYYDIKKNKYVEEKWILKIEDWLEAKIRIGKDEKQFHLERKMGIVEMIYSLELSDKHLEMIVSTVDGRILTIFFSEPKLYIN